MTLLWIAAVLAAIGIAAVCLPFHVTMTGLCLLALALVLAALWLLQKKKCKKVWSGILIALTALCMAAVFAGMAVIAVQGRSDNLDADAPDFVVVLGAQTHGSQPSRTLRERLNLAAAYLKGHPTACAFVSGGQGSDETQTEASVMAAYLAAKGIDPSRVVQESEASTTRENLLYSKKLAETRGVDTSRVLIITSDFHLARAKYIARTLGMEPSGLASTTTPWILKVNYELREVFAFVKARAMSEE
jgi:uncharacterized SAM-binding protein YcdF (DUF218 family)